jgi:Tetratricopeptide repeat/Aspartyl protease
MYALIVLLLASVVAQAPTSSPSAMAGDTAFTKGDFQTAFTDYNNAIEENPDDAEAILGLGTLDLYRNDWRNARTYLNRARHLLPNDPRVDARLATLQERLPKTDQYVFDLQNGQTDIPFTSVDPVPVVRATIDGKTFSLLVDTGAASVDLSPAAAESLGLQAGGLIDKIVLPGLTVSNVPARVLKAPLTAGTSQVDGALGTIFLSHFLPTFDYAHSRLTLRLWAASPAVEQSAKSQGAAIEPMWLVGTHLLLASGRIGGNRATLFAIQTGQNGGVVAVAGASDPSFTVPLVSLGRYAQGPVAATALPDDLFSAVPFRVGGALRSGFFRPATLTLDFTDMKIVVSK